MSQIQKIESFRRELAIAETIDDIKEIEDKAAALKELARRQKVSKDKQDELGEFTVEIESKKGAWLDEFYPHGTLEGKDKNGKEVLRSRSSTLEDVGISKHESARSRRINKYRTEKPEEYNRVIEDVKQSDNVVSPYAIDKEFKKIEKKENLKQKVEQTKQQEQAEITTTPLAYLKSYDEFFIDIDKRFDLLLTDPPYSTDIKDIAGFVNDWLPLALSTLHDYSRGYICIGAYPKEIKAYMDWFGSQDRFILDSPLIWTYRNTLGQTPKYKYNLNYQMILHFYSDSSEDLDTSITNEMFSVQDINAPDGRQGDRYHRWQKPNELAQRLIRHSTREGDYIVDPFCGSGTFLVNAGKLKRQSVGCDIDKEALEIAKQRGCDVQ